MAEKLKPTKYQRWWMGAIYLRGRKITSGGLWKFGPSHCSKINPNSFRNAEKKGWIEFKGGVTVLTPAGRKALETT